MAKVIRKDGRFIGPPAPVEYFAKARRAPHGERMGAKHAPHLPRNLVAKRHRDSVLQTGGRRIIAQIMRDHDMTRAEAFAVMSLEKEMAAMPGREATREQLAASENRIAMREAHAIQNEATRDQRIADFLNEGVNYYGYEN